MKCRKRAPWVGVLVLGLAACGTGSPSGNGEGGNGGSTAPELMLEVSSAPAASMVEL